MALLDIILVVFTMALVNSQSICPGGPPPIDIHSDSISLGLQSSISIQRGIDNKCYNYTLPSAFPRIPSVAVALNQFQAYQSTDLSFVVKPITGISTTVISFIIRTPWKLTNWSAITVNFIAEARSDVEAGYVQRDTGLVGACGQGKAQPLYLPFNQQWPNSQSLKAHVFLSGFQLTILPAGSSNSPYQIQLLSPTVNQSGLIVVLSVTTNTQVNNVYVSYFIFNSNAISMKIEDGFIQRSNIQGSSVVQLTSSSFGQIRSGLYGLSGFIMNSNNIPQVSILFGQNLNTVINTYGNLYNYIGFHYVIIANSPCFGCANNPYFFNNTCVARCPTQTVTTGYSCEQCPTNSYPNNNQCVCSQGFYNISGVCTTCPSDQRWNGSQCIGCGVNAFWQGNVCVCAQGYYNISGVCQSCPGGQQWNGVSCVPILYQSNQFGQQQYQLQQGFQQMPIQQGQFNSNQQSNNQQQIQQTQQVTGPQSCPPGVANWNGQTCVCILSGFTWNGKSCVQTPIQSQNQSSQQSSQNCPSGSVWNGQQCICTQQGFYFNGQSCVSNRQGQSSNQNTSQTSNLQSNQLIFNQNQIAQSNQNQRTQLQVQQQSQTNCPTGYYFNGVACIQGNPSQQGIINQGIINQQQTQISSQQSMQPLSFNRNPTQQSQQSFTQSSSSVSNSQSPNFSALSAECPQNMYYNGLSCVCLPGFVARGTQCVRA